MEKQGPDYPTEQQVGEFWKAYKAGGELGISEHLKELRQIREGADAPIAIDRELVEDLIEPLRAGARP